MPRFVVASMNFYDNALEQKIIEFDGTLEEVYFSEMNKEFSDLEDYPVNSIDDVKQLYFDADQLISVIEI